MTTPTALLLDVTRRCNANCRICGRRFWPLDQPLPSMDPDLALRLIKLDYIDRVCFGQYGEPLLWPYLAEAVDLANSLGKYTWTTTNGALMTASMGDELIRAGIDKVIFSIDAIDAPTYNALRTNLNWSIVLKNVDDFIEARKYAGQKLRIVVNCVRSPENSARTDAEIREFWLARGIDGVAISKECDVSPVLGTLSGPPIVCERPYDHLTVRADGRLMFCCRDCHDAAGDLGSFGDNPMIAFRGPAFTALRRALETGKDYPAMCRGCRSHWPDVRPPKRAPNERRR